MFSALNVTHDIRYVEMPVTLKGRYQYFTQADMRWMQEVKCPVEFATLEQGVADYVRNYLAKPDCYLEMWESSSPG